MRNAAITTWITITVHTKPSMPIAPIISEVTIGPIIAPAPYSSTSCEAAAVIFDDGTQSLVYAPAMEYSG